MLQRVVDEKKIDFIWLQRASLHTKELHFLRRWKSVFFHRTEVILCRKIMDGTHVQHGDANWGQCQVFLKLNKVGAETGLFIDWNVLSALYIMIQFYAEQLMNRTHAQRGLLFEWPEIENNNFCVSRYLVLNISCTTFDGFFRWGTPSGKLSKHKLHHTPGGTIV